MRDDFSTLDICKALNIKRERLRSWMKEGFIEPTIPAEGPGTRASFTRRDVYIIAVFMVLIAKGMSRSAAILMANSLSKAWKGRSSVKDFIYIIWRHSSKEGEGTAQLIALRSSKTPEDREGVFIVNLQNSDLFFCPFEEGSIGYPEKTDLSTPIWLGQENKKLSLPKGNGFADESWHFLEILNFEGLRKEVDLRLSELA